MVKISIEANEKEQRLDKFLKKYLRGASLSYVYKAIRKDVKVNGKRRKQDYVLQEGDEVSLYITDEELARFHPPRQVPGAAPNSSAAARRPRKQFAVAYEDEHLLIADKPPGLLTHGDAREKTNHLANQVIAWLISQGEYDPREKTFVPAPVNRLDRNTAGLVLFPKDYETQKVMSRLIADHESIRKFYLTIVVGELTAPLHLEGTMTRDETRNMTVVRGDAAGNAVPDDPSSDAGKSMETWVTPLAVAGGYTLCRVEIRTGRTHQIRAQMAAAGYPLAGDPKYGDAAVNKALCRRCGLTSQLLLARELRFRDMPPGYEALEGKRVRAKIPKKFKEVMEALSLRER